jgi:hypothetical protein
MSDIKATSKRAPNELPPLEYLHTCFDHKAGVLYWKTRPREHFFNERACKIWNTKFSGTIAGSLSDQGYLTVWVQGAHRRVHRIIYKLRTGEEPPASLDHADGSRDRNDPNNLRPATKREQSWNSKLRINNTSGHRGVSQNGKKWMARIRDHGPPRYLGTFDTIEDASAAYESAARELHGTFYKRVP